MGILERVASPADLKGLSRDELRVLSDEIRNRLIDVCSRTGGHIGAGLGVVELTVALHAVFETPRDQVVWDVGHQGYPHKLLTGRNTRMETLRQEAGLSGFLKRSESEFDTFGAGHAATSISAALGIAAGRDLLGETYKVVAVLGDGALTSGLAYEGLNNAGHSGRDVVVILNDNEMSIAPNVGAISKYLNSIQRNPLYNRIRARIGEVLEGHAAINTLVRKWEESQVVPHSGRPVRGAWLPVFRADRRARHRQPGEHAVGGPCDDRTAPGARADAEREGIPRRGARGEVARIASGP
jgi:1-deoxy-D-xylulose-5-phosphate synthase